MERAGGALWQCGHLDWGLRLSSYSGPDPQPLDSVGAGRIGTAPTSDWAHLPGPGA